MAYELKLNLKSSPATIEIDYCEYIICTRDEAKEIITERFKEEIWMFDADFLACHSCLSREAIKLLQTKSDDFNNDLLESIYDYENFVRDAISADGIGHYLAIEDGEEQTLAEFIRDNPDILTDKEVKKIEKQLDHSQKDLWLYRIN